MQKMEADYTNAERVSTSDRTMATPNFKRFIDISHGKKGHPNI